MNENEVQHFRIVHVEQRKPPMSGMGEVFTKIAVFKIFQRKSGGI
jgi:hypothetical protein